MLIKGINSSILVVYLVKFSAKLYQPPVIVIINEEIVIKVVDVVRGAGHGAVGGGEVGHTSVGGGEVRHGAVGGIEVGHGAVRGGDVGHGAVGGGDVGHGAVGGGDVGDDGVGSGKAGDGAGRDHGYVGTGT